MENIHVTHAVTHQCWRVIAEWSLDWLKIFVKRLRKYNPNQKFKIISLKKQKEEKTDNLFIDTVKSDIKFIKSYYWTIAEYKRLKNLANNYKE